ncbi:hypothetical protein NGM33_07705 [Nocardiopsis dassonvillei]|uniref:hypothetical protein n=1 Tax=Nocardiopsis dassonvillei TaxID=2014 RepID=UPI0020A4561A|nr:hypothetical protein [Nocardiopsis dassonvillei]MCP3013216.1 hypothetical protein [Nocardiopsis dassonvillei]
MRASFLLLQEAALGLIACGLIAGWVGITGNERANRLVQRREKAFIDTIVEGNGH